MKQCSCSCPSQSHHQTSRRSQPSRVPLSISSRSSSVSQNPAFQHAILWRGSQHLSSTACLIGCKARRHWRAAEIVALQRGGVGSGRDHSSRQPRSAVPLVAEQCRQPADVQVMSAGVKPTYLKVLPIYVLFSTDALPQNLLLNHCTCQANALSHNLLVELTSPVEALLSAVMRACVLAREVGHLSAFVRVLQLPPDKYRRSLPKQVGINVAAAMSTIQLLATPAAPPSGGQVPPHLCPSFKVRLVPGQSGSSCRGRACVGSRLTLSYGESRESSTRSARWQTRLR